ncbi:MAG: peptidylprolyl isomerase, partial [Planctomycetes bacterium]|nr:peptidylprolyl isomerase [Planctomycetota bacterium]
MKLMNSFAGRSLLLGAFSLSVLVGGTYASAQEQRKVSHILLVSKAQAEQVRKEVIAGGGDAKAFTAACYKHSKDATTKPLGGNLGFIRQSSGYDPAFSAAAFNLKTGGISEPVLTEFGWHLIHVSEIKAGSAPKKAVAASATGQKTPATSKPPAKPAATPPAKPVVVTPAKPAVAPQQTQQLPKDPGAVKAAQAASAAKAATQKAVPKRRPLAVSRKVVLRIESVLSGASPRGSQLSFRKDVAVELNLTLKNEGRTDQRLPSPALLPLGFEVTRLSDNKKMTGDFSAVAEPASYFSTLKSWEITGLAVSL